MTRSEIMARIGSRNTRPERRCRRLLRELGLRFRSQVRIAGYVRDFAVPAARVAIEVHGDFWHGCPRHYKPPKTNNGFWSEKVCANIRRDRTSARAVRRAGWRNVTLWECETETAWARRIARAVSSRLA